MFLNQEIEKAIRDGYKGQNLERDIKFILEYFGFGEEIYPTQIFLSKKYGVGKTRGGGSYILRTKFNENYIGIEKLNVLREVDKILRSREYFFYSDFFILLIENHLIDEISYLPGLFNLLKYLGFALDYDIYNLGLNKVEREDFAQHDEFIIAHTTAYPQLKSDIRKTFEQLGRVSIRCLDDVYNKNHNFVFSFSDIKRIIRNTESSWCLDSDGKFWFLIGNRENRIINLLKKVYKVGKIFEQDILAEVITKSLREYAVTKPNSSIVKKYLQSAGVVDHDERFFFLDDSLEDTKIKIEDIENAIISFLTKNQAETRANIIEYLNKLGYEKQATIDSYIEYSPFFLKREINYKKAKSRETFEIVYIGNHHKDNHILVTSKYDLYRKQLQGLASTDGTTEQKIRNEQTILRNWLFENKSHEKCALCVKEYSIKSLVAAHKKPRRYCSTNERTDPYIVMPACKMGCDFVYEERWVKIEDGVITVDEKKIVKFSDHEKHYLQTLSGRNVDKMWLQGEKSYFDDF